MSGDKYRSKQDKNTKQISSISSSVSTLEDDEGEVGMPKLTYGGVNNHLGPVSRRERLFAMFERIAPYLTISMLIVILFLLAMVGSTISQIKILDSKIQDSQLSLESKSANFRNEIASIKDALSRLAKTPGPKGEKGVAGVAGSAGTEGVKGDTGSPGEAGSKGERGERGPAGDKGKRGDAGVKGSCVVMTNNSSGGVTIVKGEPGVKGEVGPVGPPGPPGPKGERGVMFTPYKSWEWKHPGGSKGDRFDFRIDCIRKCRHIDITILHATGDVDLYGEETDVPHIVESNCQSCPLCKARSSTNKDKCSVDKSSVDTFYFSVYVHKAYDDLDVSVEASNLEKVTCLNDDCGGTVSSDLDTQDGE